MQITMESVQKISGITGSPVGLVIIQYYGLVCISTCTVKPHIALTLGFLSSFMQNLQRSFICMKHFPFIMQLLKNGLQVLLRRFQNPVGHRLPGKPDTLTLQLLLLPVKRIPRDKFLRHNIGNGFLHGRVAVHDAFFPGRFDYQRFHIVYCAISYRHSCSKYADLLLSSSLPQTNL